MENDWVLMRKVGLMEWWRGVVTVAWRWRCGRQDCRLHRFPSPWVYRGGSCRCRDGSMIGTIREINQLGIGIRIIVGINRSGGLRVVAVDEDHRGSRVVTRGSSRVIVVVGGVSDSHYG